jgi:RimJ/RimL family protein N-acetyltransferase
MLTSRLEIRLPVDADRGRFVELFCDDGFMVFSSGVLDVDGANRRFDRMLARAEELPFAKQPVIERATSAIIGYSGVDWFDLEDRPRLEFGYRLVKEARGQGYATEASRAVLGVAATTFRGEILAIIDPSNLASRRVAAKLGFTFWKQALVDGYLGNLYRLDIGNSS